MNMNSWAHLLAQLYKKRHDQPSAMQFGNFVTSITPTQNSEKLWLFHPLLNHFLSRQLLSRCLSKLRRPKATSETRHSDATKLAFPCVMLKLPDPISTGSHPEALPVSLHISAEVSGGSMWRSSRKRLQGDAKKNPHLFFILSLTGPDMQRARCVAMLFSLRFLSQQKTERATHKGLSVFHSSSLLAFLWNEKTALYKGHLPMKHFLFSLSGAFLSALYFLLVSFHHDTKRAHLDPCNVRWFSVNTLIYTITNTQPFSFNSKWMTLNGTKKQTAEKRGLCSYEKGYLKCTL